MDGTTGKAEATRRFIIEKSAPLFNRKGFAGTSLTELTDRIGLTKGSIYGNFKDKEEVALFAFRHNVKFIVEAFTADIEGQESSIEKLLSYPRVYRRIYKKIFERGGCPMLNTAVEADDTNPALHALARRAFKKWRRGIINLIEQGKKNGEIKPDTPSTAVAEIIISLFEGGGALAKATGESGYLKNSIAQIEKTIMDIRR